jgi:phosphoserine phosphatase
VLVACSSCCCVRCVSTAAGQAGWQCAGFDAEEFTSRSGGKAEACKHLKKEFGYKVVAMVGDGATDAEARCKNGADIFVCYAGVVFRDNVAKEADWVIVDIEELISPLQV